jgi:hypothetical protein
LALVPAVVLIWPKSDWRRLAAALAAAAVVSGWWYLHNVATGYPLTGWAIPAPGMRAAVATALRINWFTSAHLVAKMFLWIGGWSFLTLKSWIFRLLELFGVLAVAGWARCSRQTIIAPLAFVLCFGAAFAWGVVSLAALGSGDYAPGWYWWAMASPLALLFVAGAGTRITAALIAGLALVDFYGASAVMMPYYAGFVALDRASFGYLLPALSRLHVPLVLWLAWVAASIAIVAFGFKNARGKSSSSQLNPEP